MLKDLEFYSQVNSSGEVRLSLCDKEKYYLFNLNGDVLSLTLNPSESRYYFNILTMVLTMGGAYWNNLESCGGTLDIDYRFKDFISRNIKSVTRDIKIQKIIE